MEVTLTTFMVLLCGWWGGGVVVYGRGCTGSPSPCDAILGGDIYADSISKKLLQILKDSKGEFCSIYFN